MSGGGWFDFPLAEKAAHLNFHSSIALVELGVLDRIDPIRTSGVNWRIDISSSCRCKGLCAPDRGDSWSWYLGPKGEQVLFVEWRKAGKTNGLNIMLVFM